jgi:hypothetical protein
MFPCKAVQRKYLSSVVGFLFIIVLSDPARCLTKKKKQKKMCRKLKMGAKQEFEDCNEESLDKDFSKKFVRYDLNCLRPCIERIFA